MCILLDYQKHCLCSPTPNSLTILFMALLRQDLRSSCMNEVNIGQTSMYRLNCPQKKLSPVHLQTTHPGALHLVVTANTV